MYLHKWRTIRGSLGKWVGKLVRGLNFLRRYLMDWIYMRTSTISLWWYVLLLDESETTLRNKKSSSSRRLIFLLYILKIKESYADCLLLMTTSLFFRFASLARLFIFSYK